MTASLPAAIGKSSPGPSEPPPGRKEIFNIGRHRWLGRVARDQELSGGSVRAAILLWDMFNPTTGGAWPSIAYMAKTLAMHRSTVIRAINALDERGWITRDSGNRHRSNFYRPCFGKLDDEDEPGEAENGGTESGVAGLPPGSRVSALAG